MDLSTLEQQIARMVQNGALTLDSTSIPGADVPPLFAKFLSGTLSLTNVSVGFPRNITSYFQIIGDGASEPFDGMSVAIRISQATDFELLLNATAPEVLPTGPWNFGDAFSALGTPFSDPLPSAGFQFASFTLDSKSGSLTFSGELLVQSIALLDVSLFFPGQNTLSIVNAPIADVTAGWPSFSMSAPGRAIIPSVSPVAVLSAATGGGANTQSVGVDFTIPFAGGITIGAQFPFDAPLTIEGVFDNAPFGFNELASLFDFGPSMPPQLTLPDSFGLTAFSVTVDSLSQTVDLTISAGTAKGYEWRIASLLTLTELDFLFGVNGLSGVNELSGGPDSGPFVTVNAQFEVGTATQVDISGAYPGFVFSGTVAIGAGGLDLHTLVAQYYLDAAAFVPELTLDSIAFTLDPNSPSYSLAITADQDATWPIIPGVFALGGLSTSIVYAASNFYLAASGTMTVGPLSFTVNGSYSSQQPPSWQFDGTTTITEAELEKLLQDLGFGSIPLPSGLVSSTIALSMTQTGTAAATYTFTGSATLDIPIGSAFTVHLSGSLVFTSANDDVAIGGTAAFGNLQLGASYDVKTNVATFDWDGITGTVDAATSTISFDFPNINIGELVDRFVDAIFDTGGFSLVAPFDLLNSIAFSDVVVAASFVKGKKTLTVTPAFASPVDLGFVTVSGFSLTTDFSTLDVALDYSSFLGGGGDGQLSWNALDPSTTPSVPGIGAGILDVQYLLLAQRVAPLPPNALDTSSVRNAVASMMQLFASPPGAGSLAGYSAATDWVIGTRLVLLDGVITINAVFVDPGLYGVDIAVGGTGQFAGLDFEVMYKRVNDAIGEYQIELTLPAGMRQMSLGGVAFSLPTVMVQIYTNGNFLVDFGFPYNNDWSQSFSVQLAEFVGLGGFYFGVMNGATADLPAPSGGTYAPVILIGLAASVGFGGSVSFGILSGSISLTMGGSAEGIFAWFNPAGGGEKELWYQITGKFGFVGRITGSIDFVILSASFSIVATATLTIRFGSDGPVRFTFSASVTVSASIKIVFVRISFSFSATITESFSIGSSSSVAQLRAHRRAAGSPLLQPKPAIPIGDGPVSSAPAMSWVPIAGPLDVPLLLTPHFTSASAVIDGTPQTPTPQIVMMTYIATARTGGSPFTQLAQGALLWAINALLQIPPAPGSKYATIEQIEAAGITATQLQQVLCALQQTTAPSIPTLEQVLVLLPQLYVFQIVDAPDSGDEVTTSVFPILPVITLTTPSGTVIDFSTFNPVDAQELAAIQRYFAQLVPATPRAPNARRRPRLAESTNPSMASVILGDYFILLCRTVVQAAIAQLGSNPQFAHADTIGAHIERRSVKGLTPEIVAAWNRLHRLRAGVSIALPNGGRYTVRGDSTETLLGVARRFHTTIEELARANHDTQGFFDDAPLNLPGPPPNTVAALIADMTEAGAFDAQAGSVARMMLQGLRPPYGGTTTSALYALTGQELDATGVQPSDTFRLQVPPLTEQSWVEFGNGAPSDTGVVTITEQQAAILATLDQPLDVTLDSAQMVASRSTVAKHYGLSSPVIWSWIDGTPSWSIWKLPDDLLETVTAGIAPQLTLEEAASDRPGLPDRALSGLVDAPVSEWAMAFPITVRRIPSAKNPAVPMLFTYNLLGTDDVGSQLLLDLLQSADAATQVQEVYVLFPQQPGSALPSAGVKANSIQGTTCFVLQANFSTSANPADAAVPQIETAISPAGNSFTMLQAIWECSVVRSGGYSFFYRFDGKDGAAGLPSYLFDSDGEAELTVVVTLALPADGSVTNAMNAIVVQQTFDPNTLVYLQPAPDATTVIEDSIPTYRAGETAFTATRTFPVQSGDVSLPDTYQLLGYRIAATAGFNASNYGVPLSPVDPQAPATAQVYNSYLPVAASATDPGMKTAFAGAPPPASDPYRGIGTTLQVGLDWFDLFGNRIEETTPIAPLSQGIFYFDYLIPVSAWPSVGSSYAIALDGATPTLSIDFLFDSSRYAPLDATDQTWLATASADMAQYTSIYYQIARNVAITAATSLDASSADSGDLTQNLLGYVVQIYAYLQSIVTAQKWTKSNLATSASFPVNDDPQPPDTVIFPLSVTLAVRRTAFVDPAITDPADPAISVTSRVRPTFVAQSAATQPSLARFAKDLNDCFPSLLVATGDVDAVAAGSAEKVWLVRFGENGITCTYDPAKSSPVYYAMLPLAGSPVSMSAVNVPGYTTGQGLLPATPMSFTNVDVDLMASNFLGAVDQFLTADYVVPAWLAIPDPVTVVLDAKQTIAAAMAGNVAPILASSAPTPTMLAAAQEQLKQETLVRLSTAYEITALVQFTPTASGPSGAAIPPRLYGKPVTPAAGTPGVLPPTYAFSPVSVPLTDQASIVTFSFTTNDRADTAITLPLSIALNHLQFMIVDVPDLGYQGSSWLSFAIPLSEASALIRSATSLDLGSPEIPIPLRAFPAAPALAAQTTSGPGTCSIAEVTQWDYGFSYSYTGVTQDEIHVTMQGPAAGTSIVHTDAVSLVEALLQFTAVYPQIATDLQASVCDQENAPQPDPVGIAAINAFSTLVEGVAQAWQSWQPSVPADPSQIRIAEESIPYPPSAPQPDVLQVRVTYDGVGDEAPLVDIAGFTRDTAFTADGEVKYVYLDESDQEYLTVVNAAAIPLRTVTVFGFDVLAQTHAAATLVVKRNETYGANDEMGNPLFVLTTPAVQYITPAVPQLTTPPGCTFQLTQWTTPPATIDAYLQAFFAALFKGFVPPPGGGWSIQMNIAFTYDLGDAMPLPVRIPVGMLPPTAIAPGSSAIDSLAAFVTQWMTNNEVTKLPGGTFNFALSLFGSSAGTALPLLTIPNIALSVSDITGE